MAEVELPGEEFVRRFFPGEGDLFKALGCPRGISWANCSGPYDWSDGRPLEARPPWSKEEVYSFNYDRKTRRFDGPSVLIDLIETLHSAAKISDEALREVLSERFDVEEVLRYIACSNWGCAWDDAWQNYYLFYYHEDGKWRIFPWDMDQMFGGPCCCARVDPETSLWRGKEGDLDNWQPDPGKPVFNRLKNYFFRAFPEEYLFYLIALNNEVFQPRILFGWINGIEATLQRVADLTPLPIEDSIEEYAQIIRDFVVARREFVNSQVIPKIDPGEDLLVEAGEPVRFEAYTAYPPTGPDVR